MQPPLLRTGGLPCVVTLLPLGLDTFYLFYKKGSGAGRKRGEYEESRCKQIPCSSADYEQNTRVLSPGDTADSKVRTLLGGLVKSAQDIGNNELPGIGAKRGEIY